jgi:dethiobiotin synthetase
VAAAALLCRWRVEREGGLRYWKPIQTGIEQDDDTGEVRRLSGCAPGEVLDQGVRLRHPVSPHLAARLSGERIDLDAVVAVFAQQPASTCWIVEGAGGVLVPVNESDLMADLMVRLGLPVVVVARSSLGTINHTLLTIEALRARSIGVAGVIMIGPPNPDNREAIEHYGRVRVVGEMRVFDPLTPAALRQWATTSRDLPPLPTVEDR